MAARRAATVLAPDQSMRLNTVSEPAARKAPAIAGATAASVAVALRPHDGVPFTHEIVRELVRRTARRAGVAKGGVHILRHTFCSHLAMRGAPARAIQELAGHQDLTTTQRYMHLSPAALDAAIRLLDLANGDPSLVGPFSSGGMLEAAGKSS